jgi:hemoglobin
MTDSLRHASTADGLTTSAQETTLSLRLDRSIENERTLEGRVPGDPLGDPSFAGPAASRESGAPAGREQPAASSSPSARVTGVTGNGKRSTMQRSVFERYGGFAKVNRIVTSYYEKILDSPITSPYFANTDMRQLIDHQTRFIATVMGGPASYTNDHLERVHARHGVTEAAFFEACNLLVEAMEDENFSSEDIQIVVDELVSRKHHIVSRS